MEFYKTDYWQLLRLPIKTFWLMNSNIERIQAQKDMRSLSLVMHTQSAEAASDLRQRLIVEAGTIVKMQGGSESGRRYVHEERDEAGFAELKELSKLF